jgi:hypothetical protein
MLIHMHVHAYVYTICLYMQERLATIHTCIHMQEYICMLYVLGVFPKVIHMHMVYIYMYAYMYYMALENKMYICVHMHHCSICMTCIYCMQECG